MHKINHRLQMRPRLTRLLALSACFFTVQGCLSSEPTDAERIQALRHELTKSVRERSAEAEFKDRVKRNAVCFYSVGSSFRGFTLPGLTEDEAKEFVDKLGTPVENQFHDDPSPAFATEEYWEAVDAFLSKYNRLVLLHLKKDKRERPKGQSDQK